MKKLALLVLLAIGVLPLSAKNSTGEKRVEYSTERSEVATTTSAHSWFVSAGVGAQVYFGDHDKQMGLGNRISAAFDVAVGKWFTPAIGARLMYSGLQVKGATQSGVHSDGKPISGKPWHGYWLTEQKYNFSNLHADVMFNLVQLIGRRESAWSASPYVGIGWVHVGESPKADGVSGNFGLLTSYNLNSRLDLNLDVRGVLMKDGMDGEKGGRGEGMMTVTLGVSYFF